MIGINDIAGYKTVDEIYNNYVKIVENLEKKICLFIFSPFYT